MDLPNILRNAYCGFGANRLLLWRGATDLFFFYRFHSNPNQV